MELQFARRGTADAVPSLLEESRLRLVIFTGNGGIEGTPWWRVVCATPGVERILICLKTVSNRPADVWLRQRRNIRKHGWIWGPYRVAVFVGRVISIPWSRRGEELEAHRPVPCDRLESLDIHNPDTLERVATWKPDLGVSIGAPILRPSLFRIPTRGTINLHLGKVPDFRGAPPGFWELFTGAREIGATVHWMDEGLDTGSVIVAASAPLYPTDTLARAEGRAGELGRRVLAAALRRLTEGATVAGVPQEPGGHTHRFPTLRQRANLALRLRVRWLKRRATPRSLFKTAAVFAALWIMRPVRDLLRRLERRQPVRVFTFHRVTDLCRDGMTLPTEMFRRQVDYIRRHHDVVPMERALALVQGGARLARPVAVITFDDAYRSVFTHARPVMAARGLPACCFVSTDLVGTDRRFAHDADNPVREYLDVMTWDELAALCDQGWSVGGHSASHARLSACEGEVLRRELEEPLAALRTRLGCASAPMAYPFGSADDITPLVAARVRASGYTACFSNFGGENVPTPGAFDLFRIDLGGDHDTLAWKAAAHGIALTRWRTRWERLRSVFTGGGRHGS